MTKTEAIALRNEYVADREKKIAQRKIEENAYYEKKCEWEKTVEDTVRAIIENNEVSILVRKPMFSAKGGVRITVTNDTCVKKESRSLVWSIDITIECDGNVTFESNCWSNFSMTTKENLADIKASVSVMETILNYNWAILNSYIPAYPKYVDYVPTIVGCDETSKYDLMIRDAEMEECLTDNKIIVVKDKRYTTYYKLIKSTEKFYSYSEYTEYAYGEKKMSIEDVVNYFNANPYTERTNKIKFFETIGKNYSVVNY